MSEEKRQSVPEWVVLAVGRLYLEREQMARRAEAAEDTVRMVTTEARRGKGEEGEE